MTDSMFDLTLYLLVKSKNMKQTTCDKNTIFINDLNSMSVYDFKEASEDKVWVVKESFLDSQDIGTKITNFFKKKPGLIKKIMDIKTYVTCVLRISIVSDFAQIGFTISPHDLQLLNKLNVSVEISVFSWGGCSDEGDGGTFLREP